MDWLVQNWVWVLVLVVFVWMHSSGHGGCGGHRGHGRHDGGSRKSSSDGEQPGKDQAQSHHH